MRDNGFPTKCCVDRLKSQPKAVVHYLATALEISIMKLTPLLWIALFLGGVAMAPLGVPGNVLWTIFVVAFLAIIVTYYRAAIRQGHSGLVFLPIKKGPFGYDGLKLQMNTSETRVTFGCALLIAGILAGIVLAISLG